MPLVLVPQEAAACSWTLVVCSKWRHACPSIDGTCVLMELNVDILTASEDENAAFVETMNLDGETNLRSRRCTGALQFKQRARACGPSNLISNSMQAANASDCWSHRLFDLSMTLLRGTVLRNTEWVIGIVLFTGDSKIVMNFLEGRRASVARFERQMNPMVYVPSAF